MFDPATTTIAKGESVTFVNNAGFPHNIVFDEDAVPAGVNAEALSHDDYLNAPGESHTAKFDVSIEIYTATAWCWGLYVVFGSDNFNRGWDHLLSINLC